MKLSKKCLIILLTMFMCFNLTGCAVIDMINDIKKDALASDINKTLAQDSTVPMSSATYESYTKLQDAQNKCNNQESGPNLWKAITSDTYCLPCNVKAQSDNLSAKASNALNTYETNKASDTTYQSYLKSQEEANTKENKSILMKYLPVIAIIVVILIIVILLKKRKVAKPIVQELPKETKEVERSGQLKVNYERQLKNNCDKLGLDYESTLADYGGDARKAAESTMLMIK